METKKFLASVLGEGGSYCIFASKPKDDRRIQKFFGDIDMVVDAARNFDDEGFDVYFALATFKEAGTRKVVNAKELRSFFLDLDCGPTKDFPTQADAIQALRKFCSALTLPKPTLVNSGRGVHVYWGLSEPVAVEDWLPVAERLKKLCATHKFDADPAVTADAARVLRVPTTHNYKSDPPAPVGLIGPQQAPVDFDIFSELLGGDMIPVPQKLLELAGGSAVMDALTGNKENYFVEILRRTKQSKGCIQLLNIATDQENTSEPLWRAGLSIAKFCSDADKAAAFISNKHPDYTEANTREKLAQIKGPYTCTRFDELNPGLCGDCPNKGKVKSPIVLGSKLAEAPPEDVVVAESADLPNNPLKTYTIPQYPKPYVRGVNGGVYMRTADDDGVVDEKLIYHNDMYVVRRLKDAELGEAIVMRLHLPMDGVREFTVPLTVATSREEMRKALAMQGVAMPKMDEIMTYTTTWVNELQFTTLADEAHRQFGWSSDECKSFILGNQEIFADRIDFNPPSTATAGLFPAFEPKGTLEGWKEAINFYNKPKFEMHQFVVGAGFGTALMAFAQVHCAAIHLNGGSGVGKTAVLQAALGVWGDPEQLMLHEKDTYNSKMNRGEVLNSILWGIDELTNTPPKEVSNMLYQFTGGKQRGRMSSSSNVERHRGEPWRLLAVTTANRSLVELVGTAKSSPKAEALRVLECRVPRLFPKGDSTHKPMTDKFTKDIKNNYGHAGPVFVQYIMNHVDEVRELLETVQMRVDRVAKLSADNRFWSVGIAWPIAGLMIAKRIGLVEFDVKAVFQWATTTLVDQNKANIAELDATVQDIMNEFFNEHISNILQIKSTQDSRSLNGNGLDTLVVPEAIPRNKLVARYETDKKTAYIVPKTLKNWCAERQYNYGWLINEIKTHYNGRRGKVRLSKGTHLNLPPTDVIIADFPLDIDDEQTSNLTEDL